MMQAVPQGQPAAVPPAAAAAVPPAAAAAAADANAANARELMNRLLVIMDELGQVMTDEMPIIEARNYTNQDHFIRRKQELTVNYQSLMKTFTENQSLLGSLSKDDVVRLRESGKKLDEVTAKNAMALRFAHHATEHLLKVVINEIRKDLHKESGYSGRGIMAMAETQRARPVSVNQSV